VKHAFLITLLVFVAGCRTAGPWKDVSAAPVYDAEGFLVGRTQVDASLAQNGEGYAVNVRAQVLCSPARSGRMRAVRSREVGVGTAPKVLWGLGTVAMLAGSAALGYSWARTPDHPLNAELIGSLALAGGAATGFAMSPELFSPTVVEGADSKGEAVAEWTGEESPCAGSKSEPVEQRALTLTFSTIESKRSITFKGMTNAAGEFVIGTAKDVLSLRRWCGGVRATIALDQGGRLDETRGEALAPNRGELALTTTWSLAGKSPGPDTHPKLRDIGDDRLRQLSTTCAVEARAACVRSDASKLGAWTAECVAACLQEIDAEEVMARFDTCMAAAHGKTICEQARDGALARLGLQSAHAECKSKCEKKKQENSCPLPE